ncbi:MAG: hypothetical protein AABX88_01195, partial [Nanoarchaeota archaeon]
MGGKKEIEERKNNSHKNNTFFKEIYVISSAQAIQSEKHAKKYGRDSSKGAPNINLLEGLVKYCEEKNANLKILSMAGMTSEIELDDYFYKEIEEKEKGEILYTMREKEKLLNSNIKISGMTEPPQNIDIPKSRDRFVQGDRSVVMAFSKQRLRCVPTGNRKFPKLITTTGSCTFPNYNINRDNPSGNRRADIALRDHQYGAIVVEIINSSDYNVRHLPSQADGKFVDMGMKFDGRKKPKKVEVEALALGDLHVGETDEITMQANYEMIDFFKPKRLFIHDLANSQSINPHEKDDYISKAIRARFGKLNLKDELEEYYDVLCELSKAMKKGNIFVVPSNHDNFIYRYLASGEFIRDPINAVIGADLFKIGAMCRDPAEAMNVVVEEGINKIGELPENINFLRFEDDYKIWGYQFANHGHLGHSGGKGSIKSQEEMYGKTVSAHTHSPEVLR